MLVQIGVSESGAAADDLAARLRLLKERGVAGAFVLMPRSRLVRQQKLAAAFAAAAAADVPLWLGIECGVETDMGAVMQDVPDTAAGVLMVFPATADAALPREEFEGMLALKRAGNCLGDAVRGLKAALVPGQGLAAAVDLRETAPETARGIYVPLRDLVRDGVLSAVCLMGSSRFNFHRLRLLRAGPLSAGCGVDARGVAPEALSAFVQRPVVEAHSNPSCGVLWLFGDDAQRLAEAAAGALADWRDQEARSARFEADIAAGRLVLDQGFDAEAGNDQATVHGVAQSFTPSRGGVCPLVRIYAALRGSGRGLPPPVVVEIREDADGKPGDAVLGRGQIPPSAFGHEPAYGWGQACFDPAPAVVAGRRYWIYLPDTRSEAGTVVWRLVRNGASERGCAWSRRYAYGDHSWVFGVYLAGGREGAE
jgi:hypothetical protein